MAFVVKEFAHGQGQRYKYHWKIPNWANKSRNLKCIEKEKLIIEADQSSGIEFKWEIGFTTQWLVDLVVYCKSIHLQESAAKIQSTLIIQVIRSNGTVFKEQTLEPKFKIDEVLDTSGRIHLQLEDFFDNDILDNKGALNITVSLTIITPDEDALRSNFAYTADKFGKLFIESLHVNFSYLLDDSSSADLKIATREGKELWAHKAILKVQFPVFESIISSQFDNNTDGTVIVDQSEKTMRILLKFFYTGQLSPTWCDADTIIEFTDAAGKYQMTKILEMLDEVLGTTDNNETSPFDLHLLRVVNKMSLKNAEARLMKRVIKMTTQVKSADELLALFDNTSVKDNSNDNLLVRANQN